MRISEIVVMTTTLAVVEEVVIVAVEVEVAVELKSQNAKVVRNENGIYGNTECCEHEKNYEIVEANYCECRYSDGDSGVDYVQGTVAVIGTVEVDDVGVQKYREKIGSRVPLLWGRMRWGRQR